MHSYAEEMARIGVKTRPMSADQLLPLQHGANSAMVAGLWFPDSACIVDPLAAVRALTAAALNSGATFQRLAVTGLAPRGDKIEVLNAAAPLVVDSALVCAGVRSAALLAPFGLRAPLQAVRGYHVEMPGQAIFFDAPVAYVDDRIIVTPMSGRVRATSYMEFADPDAPADPRKPARLRRPLRALRSATLLSLKGQRDPYAHTITLGSRRGLHGNDDFGLQQNAQCRCAAA